MKTKYVLPILFAALFGCATTPTSDSAKWKQVENLVGDPLIEKLVEFGDTELAELAERRRNVRLEIESLEPRIGSSREAARQHAISTLIESEISGKLREKSLERKMDLWRLNNKNS